MHMVYFFVKSFTHLMYNFFDCILYIIMLLQIDQFIEFINMAALYIFVVVFHSNHI